uniref:TVP38/TMEM64 family membrane protein n=1 Tax=Roseihalotalea indica TaxID=2867963 RepID=A0AA49JJM1_9BACT|nr:TVP38/TMEM64 family protein [Tunicatimonas sp. TK19036]
MQNQDRRKKEGESKSKGGQESHWPKIITGIMLVGLVGSYFLIPAFQSFVKEAFEVLTSGDRERVSTWVQQFGFWGPLVIILGMVGQMFLFVVPSVLLLIVSVLAYGPWLGGLYALIGIVLASATAYIIGTVASEAFLDRLMGGKTRRKILQYTDKFGAWLVFIARIHPILSNDTISFVMGLVRLNFWKFMIATVGATVPMLALIGYLGQDMQRLETGLWWLSGVAIVLGFAYFFYEWYQKRQKKKQEQAA